MWMCFSPRKADGDTVPLLRATMTLMPVSTNGTEKSMISERSSLIVREPMAMSARLYSTWEKRHKQKANKTNTEAQQWASCSGQQFPPLYPTCALLKIEIFTHFTSNPFKTGKPQAASNKWKTFISSFQNPQGENAASQELSHPSQFFCKAFFTHIHTHTRAQLYSSKAQRLQAQKHKQKSLLRNTCSGASLSDAAVLDVAWCVRGKWCISTVCICMTSHHWPKKKPIQKTKTLDYSWLSTIITWNCICAKVGNHCLQMLKYCSQVLLPWHFSF